MHIQYDIPTFDLILSHINGHGGLDCFEGVSSAYIDKSYGSYVPLDMKNSTIAMLVSKNTDCKWRQRGEFDLDDRDPQTEVCRQIRQMP